MSEVQSRSSSPKSLFSACSQDSVISIECPEFEYLEPKTIQLDVPATETCRIFHHLIHSNNVQMLSATRSKRLLTIETVAGEVVIVTPSNTGHIIEKDNKNQLAVREMTDDEADNLISAASLNPTFTL